MSRNLEAVCATVETASSQPDQGERIAMDIDLSRFEGFLDTPVEDVDCRSRLALTDAEMEQLHTWAVNGQVSWELYHQVNNAMKADEIYRHRGKKQEWTVAFIRQQLGRTTYRPYHADGEEVHEWISGRLWPIGSHIRRVRSNRESLRVIDEVELAFSPNADLEGLWRRQKEGFEQEGIELLQRFPDNKFVQDMCFLPGEPSLTARIVLSAGEERKELTFPIALRYRPFLKRLEKDYTLDLTKPSHDSNEPLPRASTEELQEALSGLWKAAQSYKKSKGPIPAYMEEKTNWHMGEEFKKRSKVVKNPETGKTRRLLRARLDREGGSLDDPSPGNDGTKAGTLGDAILDPQAVPPDQHILLQQILDSLVDETDKQIFHLSLAGHSQKEIAAKLGISQPAVANRLKRMGKRSENPNRSRPDRTRQR